MATHIAELKEALSQALTESSYDSEGNTPEMVKVRGLAEIVMSHDAGDMSASEMKSIFHNNQVEGFSFDLWLADQVDAGVYDESVLE